MKQSPLCEANRRWARHEIFRRLWYSSLERRCKRCSCVSNRRWTENGWI